MKQAIRLRPEEPGDYRAVEEVTREAFWNHYGPGCDEHYLAHLLRDKPAFVKELDIVAEIDGQIVGNIMYTRAQVRTDSGRVQEVLTFGPLSVLPTFQCQGVGTKLIEHTKELARGLGYGAILIYGDPAYYARTDFMPAEAFGIASGENMYAAALQALELSDGALKDCCGLFFEDEAFHINPQEALAFDESFPHKERREGLPSQERFKKLVSMVRPRIEGAF